MKRKPLTRNDLEGFGSIITIKGSKPRQYLGDLFHFPEGGTFCPTYGRVIMHGVGPALTIKLIKVQLHKKGIKKNVRKS